jgi:hypothetical protein
MQRRISPLVNPQIWGQRSTVPPVMPGHASRLMGWHFIFPPLGLVDMATKTYG